MRRSACDGAARRRAPTLTAASASDVLSTEVTALSPHVEVARLVDNGSPLRPTGTVGGRQSAASQAAGMVALAETGLAGSRHDPGGHAGR
jgi:hypothetical protein